jgi:hypothetical protein
VAERPILFSGAMIRAILAGRKTQTRRPVKKPAQAGEYSFGEACDWMIRAGKTSCQKIGPCDGVQWRLACPVAVGDRLWVKETHAITGGAPDSYDEIHYRADNTYADTDGRGHSGEAPEVPPYSGKWRPSIHMPRWASRITLPVVSVRVERLHAITEEDAIAEGATRREWGPDPRPGRQYAQRSGWSLDWSRVGHSYTTRGGERVTLTEGDICLGSARMAFANLWEAINGARAPWDENPLVWVYTFGPA